MNPRSSNLLEHLDQLTPVPMSYLIGTRSAGARQVASIPQNSKETQKMLQFFPPSSKNSTTETGITMPVSFSSYVSPFPPLSFFNQSILQAVFTTRFMTILRFGWGWLILLLAVCATYYSNSMARVRRRARDDIQRELVKSRLISEHESAEWMNHFLQRFWKIYEPVLSATVVSTVDQLLSANCPPFLDSLRLSTFTLGNKAFRIDRIRTFPKTEEDIVVMDWAVSFTPNDVSDMTPKEVGKKVNPKIVLSVRVGKGLAVAGMPVLLEDLSFSGQMRIKMKLMTNFPHVQFVDLTFMEPPTFDYVLKPIGGEHFGFDIGNVSTLRIRRRYTLIWIRSPVFLHSFETWSTATCNR